jgi:excisionase family DNA binding protein
VEDLLTARQLQDLLKVDRITIYRMLGDGRLTGFKVGGQCRFSWWQIETWFQERHASPTGQREEPRFPPWKPAFSGCLAQTCSEWRLML